MATWNSRGLRGSTLEELINRTNEQYREKGLALIQKIPTPITPVKMDKTSRHITLAYFDWLFGMALLLFVQKQADFVILETGLGGRLDATNAVQNPVLSVITTISLEHTAVLGDTLSQIAKEKAGILKQGVSAVYSAKEPEVIQDRKSTRLNSSHT